MHHFGSTFSNGVGFLSKLCSSLFNKIVEMDLEDVGLTKKNDIDCFFLYPTTLNTNMTDIVFFQAIVPHNWVYRTFFGIRNCLNL